MKSQPTKTAILERTRAEKRRKLELAIEEQKEARRRKRKPHERQTRRA
jgi:hypothetical protein